MTPATTNTAPIHRETFATRCMTPFDRGRSARSQASLDRYTDQNPTARQRPEPPRIHQPYGLSPAAHTAPLAPSTPTISGAKTGLTQHAPPTSVTTAAPI